MDIEQFTDLLIYEDARACGYNAEEATMLMRADSLIDNHALFKAAYLMARVNHDPSDSKRMANQFLEEFRKR